MYFCENYHILIAHFPILYFLQSYTLTLDRVYKEHGILWYGLDNCIFSYLWEVSLSLQSRLFYQKVIQNSVNVTINKWTLYRDVLKSVNCTVIRYFWVTQKLPQICAVILRILIGKVAWFAVTCCNFWVTQ